MDESGGSSDVASPIGWSNMAAVVGMSGAAWTRPDARWRKKTRVRPRISEGEAFL